jgi:mRNA interferase MazF
MTTYNFGDILLVQFPFTDQSSTKKRPAVVISPNRYHQEKSDLIIMAITSQLSSDRQWGEVLIADFSLAGLIKPSLIKPVITTLQKNLVIRKLGTLQNSDQEKLKNLLQILFVQT